MEKVGIISDIHLSDNPRDKYRHDFMLSLPQRLNDAGCEALMVLGDLTEEKDRHAAPLVNAVADHFHDIAFTHKFPVLILRGNHDGVSPNDPFFGFLNNMPGVTFVVHPREARNLPKPWPDLLGNSLLLPHARDYAFEWEGLDFEKRRFIFAHNTFAGAASEHGHKLSGIPTSVFPPRAVVVSGDVHTPQSLGVVTYVGAPYTVDFGDDYPNGRMGIIDGKKLSFIELDDVPQKRLVEVRSLTQLDRLKFHKDDVVKVRVKMSNPQEWQRVRADVLEWAGNAKVRLHMAVPKFDNRREDITDEERAGLENKTDGDLLELHAKAEGLDDPTTNLGLKIVLGDL